VRLPIPPPRHICHIVMWFNMLHHCALQAAHPLSFQNTVHRNRQDIIYHTPLYDVNNKFIDVNVRK